MRELQIFNETKWQADQALLQRVMEALLDHFQILDSEISLAVVDDPTIHQLNRQFLNHDFPTDVLTFPGESNSADLMQGEIIVSVDTATQIAGEYGLSADGEVVLYFIHGLLHLAGLDDHAEEDARQMRKFERHFLELVGFEYHFEFDEPTKEP